MGLPGGGSENPFEGLENGSGTAGGTMTDSDRRVALDERLEQGYGTFDGIIMSERRRGQGQMDGTGNGGFSGSGELPGDGSDGIGGGLGTDSGNGTTVAAAPGASSDGGGFMPSSAQQREGDFSNSSAETYPVPSDIPEGNDDDVVARQLREAAMHEPDPELREKLWDEYRAYTGIAK